MSSGLLSTAQTLSSLRAASEATNRDGNKNRDVDKFLLDIYIKAGGMLPDKLLCLFEPYLNSKP